jgi:hypothetical protein
MRRHLTYANVAATLALVFAMTGGAFAAKHYLINSTAQINPKVIKKLKGHTGKTGKTGAAGKPGAQGPAGPAGAQGPIGPSNVFSAFNSADVDLKFKGEVARVAVAVPAGSYLVTAKLQVINETAKWQNVGCVITNDVTEAKGESEETVRPKNDGGATSSFDGRAAPSVEAAGTLGAAGHWVLECAGSASAETLKGRNAEIVAQQVGAVSRTGS